MNERQVEVFESQTVFNGYFQVHRHRLTHSLYRGGQSAVLEREVFERGHVAAVLPLDPVLDEVVLIEQFRPGAMAAGWEPWLLECVAGVFEAGESAEELVRREAWEEAGLEVLDLVPVARFLTSPGACSETVHLYCGRVDAGRAGGIHGLAEEGEDIRVVRMSVDEAVAALDEGRIVNAKTIIALHWLARHRTDLYRRWR